MKKIICFTYIAFVSVLTSCNTPDGVGTTEPTKQQLILAKMDKVFGLQGLDINYRNKKVAYTIDDTFQKEGISVEQGSFTSFDSAEITLYTLYPTDVKENRQFETVVLFSGHGNATGLIALPSYQRAAGLALAKQGYLVYIMENRGMGTLSRLGGHSEIDDDMRLNGSSWYGLLIVDGLYMVNYIMQQPIVNVDKVAVAGISTGGALSLYTASLDERIKASYVQGYFGDFETMLHSSKAHHNCNNLCYSCHELEMFEIAGAIAPRSLKIVNGDRDTFLAEDAYQEFLLAANEYQKVDAKSMIDFESPENTGHEFSVNLLLSFLSQSL